VFPEETFLIFAVWKYW